MNSSTGLRLLGDLVLQNLGSVFGCHTDSSIRIYNIKFQQPGYYDFSAVSLKLFNTHIGKTLVGISAIGTESMLSEYILG